MSIFLANGFFSDYLEWIWYQFPTQKYFIHLYTCTLSNIEKLQNVTRNDLWIGSENMLFNLMKTINLNYHHQVHSHCSSYVVYIHV